ncbi:glycosyltransferase [Nisaea sp.]|uniref:glycosyltransferase n=1 Tax=Nisaea sp. TaxID=2024842 RepID=UPI003B5186BB
MIGFIVTEGEGAREEKLAFYRGQADRLAAAGVDARIFEFTGTASSLPEPGRIAVFDVDRMRVLKDFLDRSGIRQAPIVWNPYALFGAGQGWIRKSGSVIGVIAPSEFLGRQIHRYRLGKPVLCVTVSADLPEPEMDAERSFYGPVSRIGYFTTSAHYLAHIRGAVTRLRPDFEDIEWIEMDFETPDEWRRMVPRCDLFLSVRGLCGSALPLLDLMASEVIVCGSHGGGLREIATAENGLWVDSATLDKFVEGLIAGLTELQERPDLRCGFARNARLSALRLDADATFKANLYAWKQLVTLANSGA